MLFRLDDAAMRKRWRGISNCISDTDHCLKERHPGQPELLSDLINLTVPARVKGQAPAYSCEDEKWRNGKQFTALHFFSTHWRKKFEWNRGGFAVRAECFTQIKEDWAKAGCCSLSRFLIISTHTFQTRNLESKTELRLSTGYHLYHFLYSCQTTLIVCLLSCLQPPDISKNWMKRGKFAVSPPFIWL